MINFGFTLKIKTIKRVFSFIVLVVFASNCNSIENEESPDQLAEAVQSIDSITLTEWANFLDTFTLSISKSDTAYLKKTIPNHTDIINKSSDYFSDDFINLATITVKDLKSELRTYESNASFDSSSIFASEVLTDSISVITYIQALNNYQINCSYRFTKSKRIYVLTELDCDSKVL